MDEDMLKALTDQHAGEIARLREDLQMERIRANRMEAECKKLWAAYSLARSAASRAVGVMTTLNDESATPGGSDIDPLGGLIQRADDLLGIVELTKAK